MHNFYKKINHNNIEIWSDKRLPYNPKCEKLISFRNDIRSTLKQLQFTPGSNLCATYISTNKEKVDVENILFYNIGSKAFKRFNCKKIYFERSFDKPPECPNVGEMAHYTSYIFTDKRELENWKSEQHAIVHWNNLDFMKINGSTNPASIWYQFQSCIKAEKVKRDSNLNLIDKKFGLKLSLHAPKNTNLNLTSVVKPLFDGIIASFSGHNDNSDTALKRLASRLNADQKEITHFLKNEKMAVLGVRKLIVPRSSGIQWLPNDDLLVFGVLSLEDNNLPDKWELSGKLITVEN